VTREYLIAHYVAAIKSFPAGAKERSAAVGQTQGIDWFHMVPLGRAELANRVPQQDARSPQPVTKTILLPGSG
jgi:hypothetical protein